MKELKQTIEVTAVFAVFVVVVWCLINLMFN
jgi:hypothetical protein